MYYLENIKYKSQDKNIKNIEYKFKLYTIVEHRSRTTTSTYMHGSKHNISALIDLSGSGDEDITIEHTKSKMKSKKVPSNSKKGKQNI